MLGSGLTAPERECHDLPASSEAKSHPAGLMARFDELSIE